MFFIGNGKCARTVRTNGQIRTGTGHGSLIAILVYKDVGLLLQRKFFVDIYDREMNQVQQRIAIDYADDEPLRIDLSLDCTRLAVLTQKGRLRLLRCWTFAMRFTNVILSVFGLVIQAEPKTRFAFVPRQIPAF
jgi:hypothetical protein